MNIMVSRALFVVHKLWTYLLFGNSRKRWSKAQPIAEKKTERKHVQFPRKNVCFQDKVFQDIPRIIKDIFSPFSLIKKVCVRIFR